MMTPAQIQEQFELAKAEAGKALVGMEGPFETLFVALLTGGHVLLEGVPGTAKTLMAKTLARLVSAEFTRIQFTPDLMPSDILGTSVFDMSSSQFFLKKGPLFTQICLADEINRAPAKTQSALLEAMEEKQINLDGETHKLEEPFIVIATQNPVEYEGTYPLPEAQLDRFLFKIVIPYATEEAEIEVLRRYHDGFSAIDLEAVGIQSVLSPAFILEARETIQTVRVEEGILRYIAAIVRGSRESSDVVLGAGTRAATHILLASKTLATIQGRDYVTPDDVKTVVPSILRHRLILQPETEIEGLGPDAVIQRILGAVEVPR
ncbi:MAG: AAA family ATPase [Anaerolineae bacterium]